jgi:hypothetical protein
MVRASEPEAKTDPLQALKRTNRLLRVVVEHLQKAGVAQSDENLKRELARSKRRMHANRELLKEAEARASAERGSSGGSEAAEQETEGPSAEVAEPIAEETEEPEQEIEEPAAEDLEEPEPEEPEPEIGEPEIEPEPQEDEPEVSGDADASWANGDPHNGRVSLRAARFEDLRALGMSVTQANRLLRYRDEKGVDSVARLDEVPGFPGAFRAELQARLRD